MSVFLQKLGQASGFIDRSLAPLDLDGAHPVPSLLTQDIHIVEQLASSDTPPFSLKDLPAYVDAVLRLNTGIDDRKLLLEKVLVLMSRLPAGDTFSAQLQQTVIGLLYKDLPHPPGSYLSLPASLTPEDPVATGAKKVKYAFRPADGSHYNPLFPTLGKAGVPYARSVPSTNYTPVSALPDPGLVFDTLLRREKFVPHPGGISSLFFAFADLIIHSIFNTNHADWTINDTSSYLDLSPLYGNSRADVDKVRRKDGTGRLWDDVFADSRLLFMPPSVCALLVLLNRNHNFIAEKILNINERQTFTSPPPSDPKAQQEQDDELFQRARLVNCGFFMQIILGDYVGAILGLVRDGNSWRLDPLQSSRELGHEVSPRGEGNVVSIEFNILYRWHATLSEQDAKWTEDKFKTLFPGKDFSTITPRDFQIAAGKFLSVNAPVREWTFDGVKRGPDGRFADADLANILHNATEWRAGAFSARGCPEVLRVIEVMGIEQSRSWGTCSLNEFRKFMGLKPYANFAEWNPDPKIHTAAAALYKDIDNLELHVGMQAEETKIPMPGAGLCPGYTISRAILADAVCLTRGDRFLTTEFTPFQFTSWGYQDCQFVPEDGSYGGMLTKLLFRTLPDYYPAGSAYAHFPFLVPNYIKQHLANLSSNPVDKYTWTRPAAPKPSVVVENYAGVSQVLAEHHKFVPAYESRLFKVTDGAVLDKPLISKVLYSDNKKWGKYFLETTQELLRDKSVDHVRSSHKSVDIVKDVINLLPVYWVSGEIAGLPLKSIHNPRGELREEQLYEKFADVCRYVYLNYDPANDWVLRESAVKTFKQVTSCIEIHLKSLNSTFSTLKDIDLHMAIAKDHSHRFLKQLAASAGAHTPQELAASLFAEVVPTAAHFSQAIAHVVNFYLDDDKKQAREEIVHLAAAGTKDADVKVLAFVREALRLDPPVSTVFRTATVDAYIGQSKVAVGERIIASVLKANVDPAVFGDNPTVPDLNRPAQKAGILGIGEHGLLTSEFFDQIAPRILGVVLGLKNIRRAPGTSGQFNKFSQERHGTPEQLFLNSRGQVTPWPNSLIVVYDA